MIEEKINRRALRDKWAQKISSAEKKYADYYELVKEIREYYRNERRRNKQNIFWSSVETLKPFLYFKQPELFVVLNNKTASKEESLACKILERALIWNMKQFDFDSVIKYARNDFLLSGMGMLWERYVPSFRNVSGEDIKNGEQVDTIYVCPTMFLADTEKVNVWEDVTWIARKTFMNINEIYEAFPDKVYRYLCSSVKEDQTISVYEIWDKKDKTIYYFSPEYPVDFLKVIKDPLKLSNFFPCPKPIMATLTNDGIIPVPDYVEIRSMLDELDGVNNRMRLTMQALKVSGCYDNSFPELANILDKDVTLISISDFDKLREVGGLKGIIEFAPLEQYVVALETLARRRQILIESIYEVTGVSDIMRGTSKSGETATAVNQKTNFGTLRNQDRQNDMQRFLKDLLKIKAEIICEQFAPEFLISFLTDEEKQDMLLAVRAVKLLKKDKLKGMVIDLETDGCYNQELENGKILQTLEHINEMISKAFAIVSHQPALLPLYRQMIESAVTTMPNARQFDIVMEQSFNQIQKELSEPTPPQEIINENQDFIEVQKRKNEQDFIIKKEQNHIKQQELELKKFTELQKLQQQINNQLKEKKDAI